MAEFEFNLFAEAEGEIRLTQVGRSFLNLLNYEESEFLADHRFFKQVFHPQDLDVYDYLLALEADIKPVIFRVRLVRKDGSVVIARMLCKKDLDAQTAKKQIKILVEDATAFTDAIIAKPDPRFLSEMMEVTDDYIFFKSRDHLFEGASQTLVPLTNQKHWTDLIGMTDYQVFPREYADVYYGLEKKIFSGEVKVAHEIQETLDKDGNEGWVDNRKYPLKDENGEIIGLFGIARDITELVNAKNEVKRLNIELEKRIEDQLEDIRNKDQYIVTVAKVSLQK